ncbi:aminopeptidase P family protein [Candidatus Gracilibacteria bacterium]|nr:aminopeptidase P family protein [Candidatus Gracilibacteria bacterium]
MRNSQAHFHQYLQKEKKLNGFFVLKTENIFWLTGFHGSFGIFVQMTSGKKFLISDGRYFEKIKSLAPKNDFIPILFDPKESKKLGKSLDIKTKNNCFGIEKSLSLEKLAWLKKTFPNNIFVSKSHTIEQLRRNKTADEIQKAKKAQAQVDNILVPFLSKNLKADISEKELAFKLEISLRENGKFELSFPIIIAFGKNSAIPHHHSENKKLKSGENILIDCGVKYEGLCSDMTRNFCFESVNKEFLQRYCILLNAQKKCLKKFLPKTKVADLDIFCRTELGTESKNFTHSLGHGVGLEIHESPQISAQSAETLREGEIVTCEPGLYYPGKFGIRIEDCLVVRKEKPEILTQTTKDLLIFNEEGTLKKV